MNATVKDTKQKLIDTAFGLIWKSSYGSVSVDDICKAADVKKGSFYHFFPSKVDLALAAMEQSYQLMKPSYDAIFSAETPPLERFERMADFVYNKQKEAEAAFGRVCGCPCASLGSEMSGQEESIGKKFEEIARRNERYYESALRDMAAEGLLLKTIDIKMKAQEIYAYILGQMMMARIQNNLEPMKRDFKAGLLRLLGVESKASHAA